jgi:hypothetical protein
MQNTFHFHKWLLVLVVRKSRRNHRQFSLLYFRFTANVWFLPPLFFNVDPWEHALPDRIETSLDVFFIFSLKL